MHEMNGEQSQDTYGNKEDNMVNTGYGPTRRVRLYIQYVVFLETAITTAGEGRGGSEGLLVRRLADSTTAGGFVLFNLLQPFLAAQCTFLFTEIINSTLLPT